MATLRVESRYEYEYEYEYEYVLVPYDSIDDSFIQYPNECMKLHSFNIRFEYSYPYSYQ